jgi:hypothetical protein
LTSSGFLTAAAVARRSARLSSGELPESAFRIGKSQVRLAEVGLASYSASEFEALGIALLKSWKAVLQVG